MDSDLKRKVSAKISILLETIKSLIIVTVVVVLIFFIGSLIIHNILRVGEVSSKYSGEYKNLYVYNNKAMNIYTIGEGANTIVILPSVGVTSPVLEYKALANNLSSDYKVVIVEYFGYGFSLSTDDDRTNENIITELRSILSSAEISGPYVLMSFGTSNLYAMYYSEHYPEEVLGMISVNGFYPEEIENNNFKNDYLPSLKANVKFYSILSYTGIFRWQSYLKPEKYNIDDLQNSKYYGKSEIKIYRNLLANKFLTKPMKNEINKLQENMQELEDYKYSENIATLQILTQDKVQDASSRGEDIEEYANNLITNSDYQSVEFLEKDLKEYLFNSPKTIKSLVNEYFY